MSRNLDPRFYFAPDEPPAGGAPPATAEPPAPPAAAPPAAPPAPGAPAETEDSLPDWAKASLKKARDEAAGYRTKLRDFEGKTAAERKVIAQTLGLDPTDPSDPAALVKALEAKDTEIRQMRTDAALTNAASKLGVKLPLTRAVLIAEGSLAALDPAATDFVDKLEAAISAAVEANPELKVGAHAPRGGSDFKGGQPPVLMLTRKDIERLSAAGKTDEINKARREGRIAYDA